MLRFGQSSNRALAARSILVRILFDFLPAHLPTSSEAHLVGESLGAPWLLGSLLAPQQPGFPGCVVLGQPARCTALKPGLCFLCHSWLSFQIRTQPNFKVLCKMEFFLCPTPERSSVTAPYTFPYPILEGFGAITGGDLKVKVSRLPLLLLGSEDVRDPSSWAAP